MKVLVANIPLPTNRFLVDLNAALGAHAEVVHSPDAFWAMEGDYDVVHLHFPEYMTFELQDAYANGLTPELMEQVGVRLSHWASRAAIVVTRHVLLPHDARHDPAWEKLYELVYSHADGVVHFARASEAEFGQRYPHLHPKHAIIAHQNYASLPNEVTRSHARAALRIAPDAQVMLVFGGIRNDAEKDLILTAFEGSSASGKVLLVSRWRETLPGVRWIRLRDWLRDARRLYLRFRPKYRFGYGYVEESDAQHYLNAADVLFIPRFHVLNSGNVTLGMTFGRVVVGPDSWDVGELLRETGNPVFDPDRPETAVQALDEAFRLAKEGIIGTRNKELALSEWSVEQCAAKYAGFFTALAAEREAVTRA